MRALSRRILCVAIPLALAAAASADPAPPVRRAALRVSAGDGATEADAVGIENSIWKSFAPTLAARGFLLEPLEPLHQAMRAQGVPEAELHAPMNSPANGVWLTELREREAELVWFMVVTRGANVVRVAMSPMGFRDLSQLANAQRSAPTAAELEALLAKDAPALVDAALAKLKPAPVPSWWHPAQLVAASQAAAKRASDEAMAAQAAPPKPANPNAPRLADGAQLAVLELQHGAEFSAQDARYLADVVRASALSNAPRLSVMTRENLLVLLQASGKDLADCEGECEVDTGRRIGADAVISGDVLKFGARFKLSLRLHETKGGRLIAAAVASGATLEELDADLQRRAAELLSSQR